MHDVILLLSGMVVWIPPLLPDFVSMNKDFQRFVAVVSETIANNGTSGVMAVPDVLAMQPAQVPPLAQQEQEQDLGQQAATIQDLLGDLIASIR